MSNGKKTDAKPVLAFRKMCQDLLAFFQAQHGLVKAGKNPAFSTRKTSSGLVVQRILECGLVLLAESSTLKTVSLRISYDPVRFRDWLRRLGPVSLFYADPFGIELTYKEGAWAFFVEEKRLPIDFSSEKVVEVARFRIEKEGVIHEPEQQNPTSTADHPILSLRAGAGFDPGGRAERPAEANYGGSQVSRLLEALHESASRS